MESTNVVGFRYVSPAWASKSHVDGGTDPINIIPNTDRTLAHAALELTHCWSHGIFNLNF